MKKTNTNPFYAKELTISCNLLNIELKVKKRLH